MTTKRGPYARMRVIGAEVPNARSCMRALEALRQIISDCWCAGGTLRGILVPQTVAGQAVRQDGCGDWGSWWWRWGHGLGAVGPGLG